MSKKMTPCEKLGYKVGDEFTVIEDSYKFVAGSIISLQKDDGTASPYFTNEGVKDEYPSGVACFLSSIKKVAKLKPAKQALADAIHQNGGWPKECHWVFATSNGFGSAFCWTNKPKRIGCNWLGGGKFTLCCEIGESIPNWHQTILSRDEYFTAYPEQVKVGVNNETKHKAEAEVKSESEITIKVGDWYKNGELPPVGEVCEMIDGYGAWRVVEVIALHAGFAHGWDSSKVVSYFSDDKSEFRPLRTERDKAIDEMMEHCKFMGSRDFACKLFDAGYRKEVK